jgi:hypothetical protein
MMKQMLLDRGRKTRKRRELWLSTTSFDPEVSTMDWSIMVISKSIGPLIMMATTTQNQTDIP